MARSKTKEVAKEVIEETASVGVVEENNTKEENPATKIVKVSGCERLNLRQEASMESRILEVLNSGDSLEVLNPNKDWTNVRTTSGVNGFVLTKFVK